MWKSANAMDLIGLKPPRVTFLFFFLFFGVQGEATLRFDPGSLRWAELPYGFGAAATGAAGGLPEELLKNLKKSESGRSRKRVSLLRNPVS